MEIEKFFRGMDFRREELETKIQRRRCALKRPSITVIMVVVCFCLVVILCTLSFSGLGTSSQVLKRDSTQRVAFSTKTPYKFEENLSTKIHRPEGCVASQLNMVIRHGTRYPSANDIIKIDKMLDKMKGFTSDKEFVTQLSRLGIALVNPYSVAEEKELAVVGDLEMYNIGSRFRQRLPELFTGTFKMTDFKFRSTCKPRCSQSASAFAMGFLEGYGPIGRDKYQPIPLEMKPCKEDKTLRFFDMCGKYEKDVVDNKTAMIEVDKFLNGSEVANVVQKVRRKLKLDGKSESLAPGDVKMMFLLCAFAVGISNTGIDKEWCGLFDHEDFSVMEYLLDLKSYYKRSSAFNITYESSCPLLRAMLYSMQAKIDKNMTSKSFAGIIRSAHGETLIPLYALMDLFVDKKHLMADNYEEMRSRQFRGARIAPFAGNIAIVLYNCKNHTNKVQLYSNERLIRFPCCKSEVDCDFETFYKCYEKVSVGCNLKTICSTNSTQLHDEL